MKKLKRFWRNHLYNIIDDNYMVRAFSFPSKKKAEIALREAIAIQKDYRNKIKKNKESEFTTWEIATGKGIKIKAIFP